MNANKHDHNGRFGIRASSLACLGAVLLTGSRGCLGAEATNLPPARSFVLDQVAGAPVLSADMHWLAADQPDGAVTVWNLPAGERAGHWTGGGILAFLPGAKAVLVAEGTNLTRRELLTGSLVTRLESPTNPITSLTVSPAGNVAVGATAKAELVFWNLADGRILRNLPTARYPWEIGPRRASLPRRLPVSMSAGFCRAFCPDGGRLAVGLAAAQVDLWSLAATPYNHYLGTLPGPGRYGMSTTGRAQAMEFLDNSRLAVAYNREELSVLTLNTDEAELRPALPRMSFTARNPAGEVVTGEVMADAAYQAVLQVRQLGLVPLAVEAPSAEPRTFAYSTNAEGTPVCGNVLATNSAAAIAQIQAGGLTPTLVLDLSPQFSGAKPPAPLPNGSASALRRQQTLIEGSGLEIRGLAASGDGRRLAVAGMRMDKRPGAPFGAGGPDSFVYDVPSHGEVQVWDAVALTRLATLQGQPDEKFSLVALDETGQRLAAVTDGVAYNSGMTGAQQQAAEMTPPPVRRVYVWELPAEK
jgi:hypothetical protein